MPASFPIFLCMRMFSYNLPVSFCSWEIKVTHRQGWYIIWNTVAKITTHFDSQSVRCYQHTVQLMGHFMRFFGCTYIVQIKKSKIQKQETLIAFGVDRVFNCVSWCVYNKYSAHQGVTFNKSYATRSYYLWQDLNSLILCRHCFKIHYWSCFKVVLTL